MKLHLADGLALPMEVVTEKLAFLGRTGSGKSYAAQKLAELMYENDAQFIVLDPVGIWYGLRLCADGRRPGYEIPVLGGLHGDVPLEPTGGTLVADLAVDRPGPMVIDVSQFESDAAKARFAADFADRFFFRKKAAPSAVHVFIEEAQEFVPQQPQKGEEKMVHAFTRLEKLGRNFGIGMSLISQRPQEVNKKALNQTELLFAFQMTGPQERETLQKWIAEKGIKEDIGGILPKLERGCPHVWSPAWLQVSKVVAIKQKITFDASSTPKVGKSASTRSLTPIDVEAFRAAMAETIAKAAADDPKELRWRIVELEKQLREMRPTTEKVAVAVLPEELARAWWTVQENFKKMLADAVDVNNALGRHLSDARGLLSKHLRPGPMPHSTPKASVPVVPSAARATPRPTAGGDRNLGKAERSILAALVQYPAGRTKRQVALLSGYAITGGGFNNALSRLRTLGLIEAGELMRITDAGIGALGSYQPLPTGQALLEHWLNILAKAEREILTVLAAAYPQALTKEEVAERTESVYQPEGGGFNNAISRLRTLELIGGGRAALKASDELFQ